MPRRPEFRQLLIGISTRRYFPPSGTAGLARSLVSGKRRDPAPPPMMMARVVDLKEDEGWTVIAVASLISVDEIVTLHLCVEL